MPSLAPRRRARRNSAMSERKTPASMPRRAVLAAVASALAGVALAPGVRLFEVAQAERPRANGQAPGRAVRWGLLIDTTQCPSGCDACVTACKRENGLADGTRPTDAQWIRKIEIHDRRTGRTTSAPVMC